MKHKQTNKQTKTGNFNSIVDLLSGTDLDCTALCFDGKEVFAEERAIHSLRRRSNFYGK